MRHTAASIMICTLASTAMAQDCAEVSADIVFCGSAEQWEPMPAKADHVVAQYRSPDGVFAVIQTDDVGTDDGLIPVLLRASILGSFGQGAPVNVISVDAGKTWGRDSETLSFSGNNRGTDFAALGTYWVGDDRWVLALTWGSGRKPTKTQSALHDSFVAQVRIGE